MHECRTLSFVKEAIILSPSEWILESRLVKIWTGFNTIVMRAFKRYLQEEVLLAVVLSIIVDQIQEKLTNT